jgi:hypothetical protein
MHAMPLSQRVFDSAFGRLRFRRSDEYKLGALNCLKARVDGAMAVACSYPEGSAQADAYLAGVDEGRALSTADRAPASFIYVDGKTPLPLKKFGDE